MSTTSKTSFIVLRHDSLERLSTAMQSFAGEDNHIIRWQVMRTDNRQYPFEVLVEYVPPGELDWAGAR